VSFNGSAGNKKREELNESKALLIKSFALQGKQKAWNEEKKSKLPDPATGPKPKVQVLRPGTYVMIF
jgi:hypothetical protein